MESVVRLRVNGQEVERRVAPRRLLLDFLRYDLGLTGSKEGCGMGVCGACTVLVDGRQVSACLMLTVQAQGCEISTIEGLASADGVLHPIQESFVQHGGLQCGICTPGQIMAAKALLDTNSQPSDEEIKAWMMGNLCRCTGYYKIYESVKNVSRPAPSKQ